MASEAEGPTDSRPHSADSTPQRGRDAPLALERVGSPPSPPSPIRDDGGADVQTFSLAALGAPPAVLQEGTVEWSTAALNAIAPPKALRISIVQMSAAALQEHEGEEPPFGTRPAIATGADDLDGSPAETGHRDPATLRRDATSPVALASTSPPGRGPPRERASMMARPEAAQDAAGALQGRSQSLSSTPTSRTPSPQSSRRVDEPWRPGGRASGNGSTLKEATRGSWAGGAPQGITSSLVEGVRESNAARASLSGTKDLRGESVTRIQRVWWPSSCNFS
jgi:hypothetical protein